MEIQTPPAQARLHHSDSPSSLQSSEACAHFRNEERESAAATAGTLQHQAAETGDLSILDTPEQVSAVELYLAQVEKWKQHFFNEFPEVVIEELREVYLSVGDDVSVSKDGVKWKGVTGGYPDNVVVATVANGRQFGVVVDAKFGGQWVTPTKENTQGIAYSRALMEKYPRMEWVAVQFFHPYLETEDGMAAPLDKYTHFFIRDDADRMELLIRTVVARKRLALSTGFDGPIPATPKTALCLWCANKALCPALGKLMVLGGSKHKEILVPDVFNPMQLATPEQYGLAYKFANQFELVAKAIKKRVTDAACKEGVSVAGYEIASRKERQIGSASGVKAIAIKHGITEDEFDGCVSLPITKVEEKIKQKAGKGKGAGAVRDFQHDLEESGLVSVSDGYSFLREIKADKPQIVVGDADILI